MLHTLKNLLSMPLPPKGWLASTRTEKQPCTWKISFLQGSLSGWKNTLKGSPMLLNILFWSTLILSLSSNGESSLVTGEVCWISKYTHLEVNVTRWALFITVYFLKVTAVLSRASSSCCIYTAHYIYVSILVTLWQEPRSSTIMQDLLNNSHNYG